VHPGSSAWTPNTSFLDLFNRFIVQVCPHDVRLLFGEAIVAAHAAAAGVTILAATVADP
jgi:hypothetical protein